MPFEMPSIRLSNGATIHHPLPGGQSTAGAAPHAEPHAPGDTVASPHAGETPAPTRTWMQWANENPKATTYGALGATALVAGGGAYLWGQQNPKPPHYGAV